MKASAIRRLEAIRDELKRFEAEIRVLVPEEHKDAYPDAVQAISEIEGAASHIEDIVINDRYARHWVEGEKRAREITANFVELTDINIK